MSKLGNQLKSKSEVIKRPHLTERSSSLALNEEHPVYTFQINPDSNKSEVRAAIKDLYQVTPLKVRIINVRPKTVFVRGRKGQKPGVKKAIVYLKKGDKIDFV